MGWGLKSESTAHEQVTVPPSTSLQEPNVFLAADGRAMLADFGLARQASERSGGGRRKK